MADTQRTRAQILVLFADNDTGQISAQDDRDFIITIMEQEFANPGDFWHAPEVRYHITDKSISGWIEYSCVISEATSFGDILAMTNSGTWVLADNTDSTLRPHGVAGGSYAVGESQAQVLRKGLVYILGYSASIAALVGYPYFLSTAGDVLFDSAPALNGGSEVVLGIIETNQSNWSADHYLTLRFDPVWAVYQS